MGKATEITAYGNPLDPITSFKYLWRFLLALYNNWPAMVRNLRRVRQKWEILSRVLGREGADARNMGRIYVAVVQVVLLYGSETWETTPWIGRLFGRFHHRVALRMTGWKPWRRKDGRCMYPPLAEAMEEAGLQDVENYISHFQNTVAQFIDTRPIMDLCLAEERCPGSRVNNRSWEK